MKRIKIMVNGLPGNMASKAVQYLLADSSFEVIGYSMTGPEITDTFYKIENTSFQLIQPNIKHEFISVIKEKEGHFIAIDYTHPNSVNENGEFYCKHNIPFVLGTTGGDRPALIKHVESSSICAVIAPNMGKQIVGFQAMMEWAATTFPNLFKGYSLEICESHQSNKADTSGTAKAMVKYFNSFGIPFVEDEIIKERNPEMQKKEWGVPEQYIKGHAWHTYTLRSDDGTVEFRFTHNVNGRDIYAKGTIDAALYLSEKLNQNIKGKVFSMIDVLKAG